MDHFKIFNTGPLIKVLTVVKNEVNLHSRMLTKLLKRRESKNCRLTKPENPRRNVQILQTRKLPGKHGFERVNGHKPAEKAHVEVI